MRIAQHTLLSLCFSLFFLNACGGQKAATGTVPTGSDPTPRGSRSLGIEFSNTTQSGSFSDNVSTAMSLKAQTLSLVLDWNQIETSASTYTDPGGIFSTLNSTLPGQSIQLSLTLAAIDANLSVVPNDLSSASFSNATFITRYKAMVAYVLGQLSSVTILNLQIATDVDLSSLSSSASFWTDFTSFTSQMATYVHSLRSSTKVGFSVTAASANTLQASSIVSASASADLIGINYYPWTSSYVAQATELVSTDFDRVISAYSSKTIFFQKVGYPSSAAAGSTEGKQSQFFSNLFFAWDKYSTQIPFLSISRLVDLSHSSAVTLATASNLGSNTSYIAIIETLGLRSYNANGTDKTAVANISSLLSARSW